MSTKRLTVSHIANDGKTKNSESFATTLPVNISSDTAVALDSWARGFVALTTDTYTDSTLTETQSLNELLVE